MLKIIITVTMFMTAMLCKAQVSENREISQFSRIEVASGIELSYRQTQGETSLRIEADEELLKNIVTEVKGETLWIHSKVKAKKGQSIKVAVAANNVESFKAVSQSRIVFANKVNAENMSIVLDNGAYFRGYFKADYKTTVETESDTEFNGRIETETFVGTFRYQSKVNLSGNADAAYIRSSTKAYCSARNFLTANTHIDSDNSVVIITSKNQINVNATDNASVTYFGSPKKYNFESKHQIQTRKYKKPALIAMD